MNITAFTRKFISILIFVTVAMNSACVATGIASLPSPTAQVNIHPIPETTITPTNIVGSLPTPPPAATQQPDLSSTELVACSPRQCSTASFWTLGPNGPEALSLPLEPGYSYDTTAATGRLLYSSKYPEHGAGPGNVSVGDLWWLDVRSGQTRPIVSDEVVVSGVWAPDGQNFAYVRATPETYELHWYSMFGEDKLLAKDVAFTFSVSPAGDQVAFTRESNYHVNGTPGLYIIDIASGQERQISTVDRAGIGSITDQPIWSPDGKHVLLPIPSDVNAWQISATDGSQSTRLNISPDVSNELQNYSLGLVLWSPDGLHLVGSSFPGMQGGSSKVILFGLNPTLDTIISTAELKDNDYIAVSLDQPGTSLWVLSPDGVLEKVPLRIGNIAYLFMYKK